MVRGYSIAPLVLAKTLGVPFPRAPSSSPTSGACAATYTRPTTCGIDSGLGNDRAAVAVADENAWARLKVEDPLRCGDVVLKRGFWNLYHAHVIAVLGQNSVDRLPTRAVNPGAMDEDNVFNWGCQCRSSRPTEHRQSRNRRGEPETKFVK